MENWKDIQGYEGLYRVSDMGNVKNKFGILLTPSLTSNGYLKVTLTNSVGERKTFRVHRLVATAFIPNPENKPTINHKGKDGNKRNNVVGNLEWATHGENNTHAYSSELKKGCIKVVFGSKEFYCMKLAVKETGIGRNILAKMERIDGVITIDTKLYYQQSA